MSDLQGVDDLQKAVGEWAVVTFPKSTEKTIIAHIRRELDEMEEEGANLAEESADVLLMLFHIAHRNGFSLASNAAFKFGVVVARKWGEPDSEGVVEHVREVEEGGH